MTVRRRRWCATECDRGKATCPWRLGGRGHEGRDAHLRPRPPSSFFFFNDTATTEIYTLSLHDALPISPRYFERRPTGVLVARVQGVETIREFLSSAAVTLVLDLPFLFIFLAIMLYYSVTLTLIAVAILLLIAGLSLAITPLLRRRLNHQFLLGARNQAFLTEYVSGMETVKSLQMEPQLNRRFGDYLASYLQAGFSTRQLANSYNVAAHMLEQMLTLAILCVGARMVMTSQDFTIGMLVAFQMFAGRLSQPMLHLVG